jgi:hypothetical protein
MRSAVRPSGVAVATASSGHLGWTPVTGRPTLGADDLPDPALPPRNMTFSDYRIDISLSLIALVVFPIRGASSPRGHSYCP